MTRRSITTISISYSMIIFSDRSHMTNSIFEECVIFLTATFYFRSSFTNIMIVCGEESQRKPILIHDDLLHRKHFEQNVLLPGH